MHKQKLRMHIRQKFSHLFTFMPYVLLLSKKEINPTSQLDRHYQLANCVALGVPEVAKGHSAPEHNSVSAKHTHF